MGLIYMRHASAENLYSEVLWNYYFECPITGIHIGWLFTLGLTLHMVINQQVYSTGSNLLLTLYCTTNLLKQDNYWLLLSV